MDSNNRRLPDRARCHKCGEAFEWGIFRAHNRSCTGDRLNPESDEERIKHARDVTEDGDEQKLINGFK